MKGLKVPSGSGKVKQKIYASVIQHEWLRMFTFAYHRIASPLFGWCIIPRSGNAVPPPTSTSVMKLKKVANRSPKYGSPRDTPLFPTLSRCGVYTPPMP